jgi:hypothetical protein
MNTTMDRRLGVPHCTDEAHEVVEEGAGIPSWKAVSRGMRYL